MENSRISPFGTLLRSCVQFYSAKALILLMINLVIIIPALLIIYAAFLLLPAVIGSPDQPNIIGLSLFFLFLAAIFVLASFWSAGALLIYIIRSFRGETVNVLLAYQAAAKRYGPFLKVNMIYSLKAALWGLLLALPGLYFGIVHGFAPVLVIDEGLPIKEAMAKSKALMKSRLIKYTDYLLFAVLSAIISCVPFFVLLDYLIDWCILNNYWRLAVMADIANIIVAFMAAQFVLVFYVRFYEEIRTRAT